MKSLSKVLILCTLILGAAAQSSEANGDSTASAPESAAATGTGTASAPESSSGSGSTAAFVCPATYQAACPFVCGGSTTSCTTKYIASGTNNISCKVCPGVPAKCPTVASASCAFLCENQNGASFCYESDITDASGFGTDAQCAACGGGAGSSAGGGSGSGTGSNSTVSSSLPQATFTGGASGLQAGRMAVVGLVGMVFAF
ncbi:hypothetical protein TWF694_003081 [Orbilia ellipsospora]|uniref:Uncharacterized protein n=1 Tax=Orbilia ellipsospora TaxID=2528407 RepID=A0AAV9X0V8_9PEZI